MYTAALPLSPLQAQINTSLDYIETQQRDLGSILDSYEAQIGDLSGGQNGASSFLGSSASAGALALTSGGPGGQAEREREKAYSLAASLSSSLDTTSASLASLIDSINALSPSSAAAGGASEDGPSKANEDPLGQIAAILNSHLNSLTWIESTTDALRKSVRDLEGRVGEVSQRMGSTGASGTPLKKRFA